MVGLLSVCSRVARLSLSRGMGILVLLCVLFLLPSTSKACRIGAESGEGDPSGPGSMIQVLGHEIQGNILIIRYDIEYPGMTKVKLFNGNNEMLWRSQYVDDSIGVHELKVKASALSPGNYTFEFDYKNQKRNYPISM